ncbi:MAG: nuclear transport factor 2 family protein [Pyrinomonadaceae bacterium]|nr:nuclear transport factor 2 family protein [Pyrinomonadaceae bacterium]
MQNQTRKLETRINVVLAMILAAGVTTGLHFAVSAHDDNEKAVSEVLKQEAAAFEKGDVEALNKFWANDEWVSVFESGGADIGWANYRDHHLSPEMKELKNTKHTLSDIRVRVAGKTAWATFKYSLAGDLKERHIDVNGLGTAILEERNGRWLIVHRHTSARRRAPVPAPAASPAKN